MESFANKARQVIQNVDLDEVFLPEGLCWSNRSGQGISKIFAGFHQKISVSVVSAQESLCFFYRENTDWSNLSHILFKKEHSFISLYTIDSGCSSKVARNMTHLRSRVLSGYCCMWASKKVFQSCSTLHLWMIAPPEPSSMRFPGRQ